VSGTEAGVTTCLIWG